MNRPVYLLSKKLLNKVPSIAPWINIGKNIPPATPDVNEISENKVFTKYKVIKNKILSLCSNKKLTKPCPLPNTIGYKIKRIKDVRNATCGLNTIFKFSFS